VIKPRCTPFEERGDNCNPRLARHLGQPRRRWPRNGLGKIEEAQVLALAEVLRAKKLRQAHNVGAPPRSLANMSDCRGQIRFRVRAHAHLHQPNFVLACIHHGLLFTPALTSKLCFSIDTARPTPTGGIGLHFSNSDDYYCSRISTAAAMVVVHSPFLSPTADCVMLLVRTILLEMR